VVKQEMPPDYANPSGQGAMRDRIIPNPKLKLLEQVREVMRLKHYSIHTERSTRRI